MQNFWEPFSKKICLDFESNEPAHVKDNETTFGYGPPTVPIGALSLGATRPGCRRVAFGAKVGVAYTAADSEELSSRLIATTDPVARNSCTN